MAEKTEYRGVVHLRRINYMVAHGLDPDDKNLIKTGCCVMVARLVWDQVVRVRVSAPRLKNKTPCILGAGVFV